MSANLSLLKFDSSYFEPETRDGFFVTGLMKRAWAAQLEILSEISMICKKNNIQWYAHYGTLLGAIRHKGFIPWDDDIDIVMKRSDYNKFISIFPTESKNTILAAPAANNSFSIPHCFFARILNTISINFDEIFLSQYHFFPYSAGVDIFPLDGIPNEDDERDLLYELIRLVLETDMEIDTWDNNTKSQRLSTLEQYCNISFDTKKDIHQQLLYLADALSQTYSIDECDKLGSVGWNAGSGINCLHSKDHFTNFETILFENTYINIPQEHDTLLRETYGNDYMTPILNTQSHEYPFWKAQKISAHSTNSTAGWPSREQFVASELNMHIDEVFEIQRLSEENNYGIYLYFCQKEFLKINIPNML